MRGSLWAWADRLNAAQDLAPRDRSVSGIYFPLMAQVVICGAGIAGISTAFHLTRAGIADILVVDPLSPLTLTSDKSTECYRNWWPNEPMVRLMGRSIERMDEYARESDNVFGLNRRGYLYLTCDQNRLETMGRQAELASAAGAGHLRIHNGSSSSYSPIELEGYESAPPGADLFLEGDLLRRHFPSVAEEVVGGLHARTAGWMSAQQLGMWLMEQAIAAGATFHRAAVSSVDTSGGRVSAVGLDDGTVVQTRTFINAAGPHLRAVGRLVGVELPVTSEVHAKTAFRDHRGLFPRDLPMVIWSDPQQLDWTTDEAAYLRAEGRSELLDPLPAGCHGRPEGGPDSPWGLGLWEYHSPVIEPRWPIPTDPLYPEVVLRGLSTILPELDRYRDRLPETVVDAGYYTKTPENRPLAGPVGPDGSYVCGALSGFGIMAACGVGELVAHAVGGLRLPDWAASFDLRRYEDAAYVRSVAATEDSGQL